MVPIVDATPAKAINSQYDVNRDDTKSEQTYTYTVRSGDTLGTISQRYLGASSRYTELLKLNKLSPNSSIFVGQKLKLPTNGLTIPKSDTGTKVSKTQVSSSPKIATNSYPELEALIKAEEYNQAIQWALKHDNIGHDDALQKQLIVAAKAQSTYYKRQQKTQDAKVFLSSLLNDSRLSASSKAQLRSELATLQAEQRLVTAKELADKSQFDESYNLLLSAWNKVGKPLEENILFTTTRNKVSENYHQQALRLYRNQKLDDALIFWEKILAINPNDDLALVYQDRVKALQNKLDNL